MWSREKAELVEPYLDKSEEIKEYQTVEDGQEFIVYLKSNIDFFGRHHLVRALLLLMDGPCVCRLVLLEYISECQTKLSISIINY